MIINYLKKNYLIILLLIVLSSIFRIFFQQNIQFASDESVSFYTVYDFLVNHHMPNTGMISSTGFYNFPLFPYFMSLLSLVHLEIRFLTHEIAVINVVAVVGFYILARKFYSQIVAVTSSLLLSLAPWPILFSRIIWQQDVIIIFLLPFLYFLHQLIYLKDKNATFWVFLFGALVMQIHASCIFFVGISAVYAYSQKVSLKKLQAIIGTVIGFIPAIPYFKYQFFSGLFCMDCERFSHTHSGTFALDHFNFLRSFELFTTFNFNFELGKSYSEFVQTYPLVILVQIISLFCVVLALTGLYVAFKKNKKYRLLAMYVIFLPILYFLAGNVSYIHYYVVLIPVMALLCGIGFDYLLSLAKKSRREKVLYGLLGLTLISFFAFELVFNSFLTKKKVVEGDYARIYEVGENIITSRLKRYEDKPFYTELKYYGSIYIYSSLFHLIVGDFVAAKHDYKNAMIEYSLYLHGTSDLPGTPDDKVTMQKLADLKKYCATHQDRGCK